MQALTAAALFGLALALSVAAASPADKPPADEKTPAAALEGGYTIVSGERDGKPIPDAEIKGALVRFTGGKVVGTDKDRKEFFAASYTVDTTKKPWKIDMKTVPAKGGAGPKEPRTATGLVKKEGDTLTLIYALPGGDAPTEFKTKAKQQMFVLKSSAEAVPLKK
jgi:uncharacterized protein (TIGR03067 family)